MKLVSLLIVNFKFNNRVIEGDGMKIGVRIKQLRLQKHLTQEELANRAELSKGFISQIERDLTSPSIATLVDILQCLGTDLKSFFNDYEDDQVVFKQKDYFMKIDDENLNSIEWVIPNAQKNAIEPILLTLEVNGQTIVDKPHEGEEFGYVLKGKIQVIKGTTKYVVKSGESFYYISDKNHWIQNIGDTRAKLFWVSSPPSF